MKERLLILCRRQVEVVKKVVKDKLVALFRRFVLFARKIGANRERDNKRDPQAQFEWPYVMNSSIPMLGPIVPGSWVWRRHHKHWHHGYYRVRL